MLHVTVYQAEEIRLMDKGVLMAVEQILNIQVDLPQMSYRELV